MKSEENGVPLSDSHSCPQCGSKIPRYPHYSTWCDSCHWNLQPVADSSIQSKFSSWSAQVAKRIDENRFEEVMGNKHQLKKVTLSQVAAIGLSTSVILTHLVILFLTGSLIFSAETMSVRVFSVVLSAFIIWAITPRIDFIPSNHYLVSKEDAPTLHHIVQRVATNLDIKVNHLLLTDEFTASFRRFGVQRKPSLSLGLPFISLLTHQELVSLIAHELSHGHDGALTRSLFVRTPLGAMRRWQWLVTPSATTMQRWETFPLLVRAVLLLPICLGTVIGLPFGLFAALIELCCFQDSQRAEYVADARSITVAGTRSALTLLRKSYLQYMDALMIRYRKTPAHRKHEALIQQLRSIPQREIDRIWQIARQQPAKMRGTHPSLPLRVKFLQSFNPQDPTVLISAEDFRRLQNELAAWPVLTAERKEAAQNQLGISPSAAD